MEGFLFYLFLVGVFAASLQDLKRREVDNWLNFLLLTGGFGFVVFYSVFSWQITYLLTAILSLIVMFALANLFYYGRIFAGGDAKLMIALAALFASGAFGSTLVNIGIFILFLMISGSIYGLVYGLALTIIHFREIRLQIVKDYKTYKGNYILVGVIVLALLGFLSIYFLILACFVFLAGVLFLIAKAIEKKAMIRTLSANELREGDWLVESVKVRGKIIKADWEGLIKKDLVLLKKYRGRVKIREGIPFVPAFFIALVLYAFKDQIISFFLGQI